MSWLDSTSRVGRRICLALGLTVLVGCVHQPNTQQPVAYRPPVVMASPVLDLLGYARRLAETNPAGREDAVRAARRQVDDEPGALSYAHLSLALGSPHQRLYTPDEAARYAELALDAEPSPWDAPARQYLNDYERLYEELTEADDSEDKMAELKDELAKARQKIRALTSLEDRLNEVEDTP